MNRVYYFLAATILIAFSCSNANSAVIDTLYADSTYGSVELGVTSAPNAFGKPDNQYAKLFGAAQFDVVFYRRNGSVVTKSILPIKANATLVVWGKKDTEVDSSAGAVSLCWFDGLGQLQQTEPYILGEGMNTITVPNQEFEYLEFTLPGAGLGTPNYAKSYYIDAIAVMEDTTRPSSVMLPGSRPNMTGIVANYPNPFSNYTTVSFTMPTSGEAMLVAVDMQGSEIARSNMGYLGEGAQRASFELHEHGMYFLRLFVDGRPVGNPIKVVSE